MRQWLREIAALILFACGAAPVAVAQVVETVATATTGQGSAETAKPAHWTYEGEHGPAHWGALDPAYGACDKGKAQSPIDIAKVEAGGVKSWKLDYKATTLRMAHHEHVSDIVDNGHTIQVIVDEGSTLTT
jgi:carbonic anhydrase